MLATTSFETVITIPKEKEIKVNITQGQNINDLCHHLVHLHAIPPYVTTSLYSAIVSTMTEINKKEQLSKRNVNKQDARQSFVQAYQSNTLQYNTKQEEDIFPRAYHTLVHCPVPSIFDTLLELEQSYAIAIQELQTTSEQELLAIQTRQAHEIENSSNPNSLSGSPIPPSSPSSSSMNSNNMTSLFTRQVEEMEVFQATWQSDIMQTQQTQRQEYREFVIELYKEYQSRLTSLSDEQQKDLIAAEKKLDGKEMVALAASRVRQWEPATEGSIKSGHSSKMTRKSRAGSLASNHSASSRPSSIIQSLSPNLVQQQSSPKDIHAPLATSPSSILSPPPPPPVKESAVKSIQEMGFEKEQAETALLLSNQNMEAAIGLLLENPAKVDAHIAEQKALGQSTPYRRSQSLSQVPRPNIPLRANTTSTTASEENPKRRHSLQKFATTPTFLNIMGGGSNRNSSSSINTTHSNTNTTNTTSATAPSSAPMTTNKSWNPISFLQQQKQNMENTNLSSVRKLGGWLGKAMENLGIEHDEEGVTPSRLMKLQGQQQQQHNAPQLVESFTIMMGTSQVKSTHNLRLLVTDEATEIFNPVYDPPREMAYRAETATKLYTSHLSAAIVLVEVNELLRKKRQYKFGKGSNKALFQRCQQSTEFHFPDIETQLVAIEKDFEEGTGETLKEGTVFITKHSNLPSTQVIFHLAIDSANVYDTISNRHPLILGLRHILKMTAQFDISSLSIPLLLLPDRFSLLDKRPQQDMNWLQKRGEVVMKCIKGFLIENSRSGKNEGGLDRAESSIGSGGMRNIEFLLPSQPDIYLSVNGPVATASTGSLASMNNNNNSNSNGAGNNTTTTASNVNTPTLSSTPDGLHLISTHTASGSGAPQEVEIAFQQFRSLLVNLFRTS